MSAIRDLAAVGDPASSEVSGPPDRRQRLLARAMSTPTGVIGMATLLVVVFVGAFAPLLAPADPFAISGPALAAPSAAHLLGTDGLGRDLLSGVVFGARTSLVVAGCSAGLVLLVGTAVGLVSGYVGGWLDDVLMRVTEAFQVLPRFFLALVVIAFFGPGLDRLVLVLGLTSWPILARVIRAEVLTLRQREFVDAARIAGASVPRILLREVLPNALPPAIALLGLLVGQIILIEAGLSFLGLGDPDAMSWGTLVSEAQRFLRVAWWLSVFPGLAIGVSVLGLNLLADALTDALTGRR